MSDGVLGNNLIGPNIIEDCLAALYYKNFSKNKLLLYLEDVTLAT
jgi:hypothetical protein